MSTRLKIFLLSTGLLMVPVFGYLIWHFTTAPTTLSTATSDASEAGRLVQEDFRMSPSLPFTETDQTYTVEDTASDGIQITFANTEEKPTEKKGLSLSFPKDYAEPIEVRLDDKRTVRITDLSGRDGYTSESIQAETLAREGQGFFASLFGADTKDIPRQYLRYVSDDERTSLLYSFQKDHSTGEKKLKHWTLYREGTGLEREAYRFENAKVKITDGKAEIYYFGEKDIQNEAVTSAVDTNLLERAQRTLAKEMGEDIMNGGHTPDFVIPAPYYLDRNGDRHEAEWQWNEESKTLSVSFNPESYPIALDPTLSFTAPGQTNSGSAITGGATSDTFGTTLASGDFNADGKTDLVVGATDYSTSTGRAYIFYNDGSLSTKAATADVIITGGGSVNYFSRALAAGDFNADGKTDLAVGADGYFSNTGRAYIFYNDGSIPTTAATADVTITGETTNNYFGYTLTTGDFNADGKTDLAVGATGYTTNTGRAYIFYNDGSIPTTAGTADVTITGETTNNYFGRAITAGDFNADGKTDLAVSAHQYSTNTGRAYIFHNDGSIPTTAGTADVTITGGATTNYFGITLASGDFNADGKTDLAVGATGYSTSTGRAYIFHNDGSIPTTAGTADVIITGEATNNFFGIALASGDFNADGKTDLAVGAHQYSTNTGRAYIFYNDGSIPTTAATADVIITGETTSNYFGITLASGDFNADGKTDLSVGATGYSTSTGRAYVFYSQNGQVNTNFTITGGATSDSFGGALAVGDFNTDGKTDLAVGATGYSTSTGRAYIFYNDGSIPTTAATADVTITGEATNDQFGVALAAGDFNADGRTDLAVSGWLYSTTGRAYIFHNDGSIPTTAATADVIITGEASSTFGSAIAAGDFNADGEIDLVVSDSGYSSNTGRAYIFHNDGSIPTTAVTADVIITGEATGSYFGYTGSLITGDFNADGRTDLALGSERMTTSTGRAYIFHNDGSIPTTAATADVIITGETTNNYFGRDLGSGDFNADGRTDFVVGAYGYSTNTGRAYIFYNDGSIPTTAATADVTITGGATSDLFGRAFAAGDFNADGKIDLAVGAYGYTTSTGRAYIFYNDGSIPTTAATADVIITGDATTNYFGIALAAGDFNADGRTDLAVGAYGYSSSTGRVYLYQTRENFAWELQRTFASTGNQVLRTSLDDSGQELKITGSGTEGFGASLALGDLNSDGRPDLIVGATAYSSNTGRVYVFYADGSLAGSSPNADLMITGELNWGIFGSAIATGDFNSNGTTDLLVTANDYNGSIGRAYIFYSDGSFPELAANADVIVAGETGSRFGTSLAVADFNADGTTDFAISGHAYSSDTGRAYIFHNDGSIPTTAATADVTITGNAASDVFGISLAAGDFNADGRTDLAVGAEGYSTHTGRVYIFHNDGSIPTTAATADVTITGPGTSSYSGMGYRVAAGDFNTDGRTDLAATTYRDGTASSYAYIFYNDGSIPTTSGTADVTITGDNFFGSAATAGDFNADGRTDLAIGANYGSDSAYIFYNDGSIATTSGTADVTVSDEGGVTYYGSSLIAIDINLDGRSDLAVGAYLYPDAVGTGRVYLYTFNDPVITGGTTGDQFGWSLVAGDFNADGRTDLAVGANAYSSSTGRAYVFYNDGTIPAAVASADAIITGEASGNSFGYNLVAGDFNADGKTDLVVSAPLYSTTQGKIYFFYNGSITTENASGADYAITGDTSGTIGRQMVVADLNTDGRVDLAATQDYSGKFSIFYNDGSIPTLDSLADFIDTSVNVPSSLAAGDFNSDGRVDLAVGDTWTPSATNAGSVDIFYNDGTYGAADVTITGGAANDVFGTSLISGDFNADGRTDLAVGAQSYTTNTGRAYIFYNDGSIPTTAATADAIITGEGIQNNFGYALASGDLNADGRTDLIVGARQYNTDNKGRVYVFYNGSITTENASSAESIMTGTAGNEFFGHALAIGDFNTDGKADLATGAYYYSSQTGRVHIFASEAAAATRSPGSMTVKGTGRVKGNFKWK